MKLWADFWWKSSCGVLEMKILGQKDKNKIFLAENFQNKNLQV